MNQDRRQRRDCSLFPIDAQFPKLDVAGSIPVSRSWFQELSATCILLISLVSKSITHPYI
jgi:hypothetical protein